MKSIVWDNLKVGIVAAVCVVVGAVTMFFIDHRGPGPAPPADLSLPATVTTDVGKPVMIEAATSGKIVKWHAWDRVGLVSAGDKKTWAHSDKAGVYKVYAYTAVGNMPTDMVFTTVTVGTPAPVPPGPDPTPPGPTDPLWATLKAAFDSEANKSQAAQLAAIYRQAGPTLAVAKTQGDLIATLHAGADSYVGKGTLPKTRRVLADELNAKVPATTTGPLTDALRQQYTAQFSRFAGLLEGLAK